MNSSDDENHSVGSATASLRNASYLNNDTDDTGSVTRSIRNSSDTDVSFFDDRNFEDNNININNINDMHINNDELHYLHLNNLVNISEHEQDSVDEQDSDINLNEISETISENNYEFLYERNIDDYINESAEESDSDDSYLLEENDPLHFTSLYDFIHSHDNNETVNVNLVVNQIEMMLAIMKYSNIYNLPNSATADLCKMINSFFETPIIPESRYKIDKLFYPGDNITYHCVCPDCNTYIGEFSKKDRALFCRICEKNVDLKDPSYRSFFVTFKDFGDDLKYLIESNDDYYNSVMFKERHSDDLQDFHDGDMYTKLRNSLPEHKKHSFATVTFNSDGSPIFQSSKFSIWPIQMIVNEVPLNIRNSNPVTYALWFGNKKPNMTWFLSPFVNDLNKLSSEGLVCKIKNEEKTIYIFAVCCCVDSIARAPMQGLTQFNGYYGCNWCLHPGELVENTVKYTLNVEGLPPRRTHEETINNMISAVANRVSVYGVKRATPLINLEEVDIIRLFVEDSMHNVDQGVARQFSNYWFSTTNKAYSISKNDIANIDQQIKLFKVPNQVTRLSRPINDRKFWKAREWQNWTLFYSLVVLRTIPDFEIYYTHWSWLVEAYHIILSDCISREQLMRADYLFKKFVAYTEMYYGPEAMTFNVHQLIHISRSIEDWGPAHTHHGYPFESGNGKIVRSVHAAKGVLNQLCRNLSIKHSLIILYNHVKQKENSPILNFCSYLESRCTMRTEQFTEIRYFGKPKKPNAQFVQQLNLSPFARAYIKIVKNNSIFKSSRKECYRSNNSFGRLKNGHLIQIDEFIVDDNDRVREITLYKRIEAVNIIENDFSYIQRITNVSNDLQVCQTSEIEKVCVVMNTTNESYVSTVPNMSWY